MVQKKSTHLLSKAYMPLHNVTAFREFRANTAFVVNREHKTKEIVSSYKRV